jgi:exopolysaccharide production protein ExoY
MFILQNAGIMPDSIHQTLSTVEGPTKGGSLAEFGLPPYSSVRAATKRISSVSHAVRAESSEASGVRFKAKQKASSIPLWKRSLDICCVLMTAPLWLPIMIFLAVWIKVVSKGPVFFRQTRVGKGGKSFTMLKFRSMKTGAETASHENHFKSLVENGGSMIKLDSLKDRRIIPGGRFLRTSGLDELPQLFNVLMGEMSLVGPRPCIPAEVECYTDSQRARFDAAPGITGYWQVNGKNKTTFNQMVEMDIQYTQRMSLVFDLVILFGTVPALAMQAIESRWHAAAKSPEDNAGKTGTGNL